MEELSTMTLWIETTKIKVTLGADATAFLSCYLHRPFIFWFPDLFIWWYALQLFLPLHTCHLRDHVQFDWLKTFLGGHGMGKATEVYYIWLWLESWAEQGSQ